MSRCHVAPHVIETEIESFLDNFKYVTSLLQSEFAVLDCRSSPLQSSSVLNPAGLPLWVLLVTVSSYALAL